MRAYIPNYDFVCPHSLVEAVELLAQNKNSLKPIAGGTDLMVLFEAGKLPQGGYLNLWGLKELTGIKTSEKMVTLGALTTFTDIIEHPLLQREFPLLCQAASEIGAIAIQNRATLGGNLVNASPAADSPPALLVYDAEIELVSKLNSHWIPYSEFHIGYKKIKMKPDELLSKVRLNRGASLTHQSYRKIGTRRAQAISKVCFAATAQIDASKKINDVRIALGSVAPIPLRCFRTEKILLGRTVDETVISEAISELNREIKPIDDLRSTQKYRRKVARNLLQDFLERF